MRTSKITMGAATGLTLALTLAACGDNGAEAEEPMPEELATETVDENSVALADAVGELAGDDARESFLRNWREHIDYFVDYAVAAEAGD
ncbi:hypothetical protein [Nesterenkonia natronophila]|uniref:Uncharacterized protein n=1 Tax=Nesterenkonia natronophila TaxID=2174932 RepID=A0A3A4G1M7_9MICC|nr:hypothetical protein [Nesterenkonia natronophila]RJN31979.1 hypothetical protein D3250_07710 [Nesterenkonia natronophila]